MLKKVRMFEVVPGTKIMVSEIGEMPHDDACAQYIANEPRFKRGPLDPTLMPEQWLRNKLARNKGWSVCRSGFDTKTEEFWFECAINASTTEVNRLNYDQVCELMHWKSWTMENRGLNVRFVLDEKWFEPLPAKPAKKAAKRGRKAKAAK